MLLQAYDFVYLNEHYGCDLQVGGSDQWGNITAGIDLGRRFHGKQLYGITCPLLTKSDGSKMGKTESGALWLSTDKTNQHQFYQYWINMDDADVGRCLRFFTDLGQAEVDAVLAEHQADPSQRSAQRRLADELTRLVHGEEGLRKAQDASKAFFPGRHVEAAINDRVRFSDFISVQLIRPVPRDRISGDGLSVVDALIVAEYCKSKSEARRLITQGGAYVNNRRVLDIEARITPNDLASDSTIAIRAGKKNYMVLKFE